MNIKYLLLIASAVVIAACSQGPESPRGFSLPEGNVDAGKYVFKRYQCLACHTIDGVEDDQPQKHLSKPVKLGGEVSRVKTYAALMTSIINPSHKIAPGYRTTGTTAEGKSKMPVYNDIMTVSELVDLVAFLQVQYEVKPEQYTHYNVYHIP